MNWQQYLRKDEINTLDSGENVKNRALEIEYLTKGYDISKEVLDVGGSVRIDNYLINKGFKVKILTLKKTSPNMVYGDMHILPFVNDEFKTIFCMHTLEHAISPYIVLCEINRVLKQDGHLILIFPEEGDFWTFAPHHYYCLTIRQIWSLLLKTGFDILKTTRFRFRYGDMEYKQDLGLVCIKKKDWKHDLKEFNINLIPFNGEEIQYDKLVKIQEIFYMEHKDKIKNSYMS